MSPDELRRCLRAAHLTVSAAAKTLGMTERHIYRYLSGQAEIPRVVELAIKTAKGKKNAR